MRIFVLLTAFFVNGLLAVEEDIPIAPIEKEDKSMNSSSFETEEEEPLYKIEYYPEPEETSYDGEIIEDKVIHLMYSDGIVPQTTRNVSSGRERRRADLRHFIRSPQKKGCKIPEKLKSFRLDCVLYPSKVKCKQTCIFGHTLSKGPTKDMTCTYKENKWKPAPKFEECKPFVDCGVKLNPGGKYKCWTNFMDEPPKCEISCQKNGNKPVVKKKMFHCSIKGKWTPKLPHCVKAGSGLKVVSPPKKIHQHNIEEDYSEDYSEEAEIQEDYDDKDDDDKDDDDKDDDDEYDDYE